MNFLAPWILYGLGALSLPILIHLWQRRRVIEIPISTLRYLKAIAARTSRSSKIENLLLLLLRCLLFILVILAAARPVMLAKTAQIFGGEIPRTIVLLIDNSLSMGYTGAGQTRLETAKSCARLLLEDLKQGDRVAIIACSNKAELMVAEPTIDRTVARKALDEIQLSNAHGDFASGLREAAKIVAKADRGIRQIFFFTDHQESGWRSTLANPASVFDTTWQQAGPQFAVVRTDDLQALNTGIRQVRIDSPSITPGGTIKGLAIVENFSTTPLNDLLKVSIGNQRVTQKPFDAAPGATAEIPFEFQAPDVSGHWARGTVSLSGDNLPADDSFFFTLPVYQSPRAIVAEGVSVGAERLRSAYFLRKALTVGGENPIQMRSIPVAQLEETSLENQSVVFLADPGRLGDRSVARLERFLEGGGTVVLFAGDHTQPGDLENLSFLPGKPTRMRTLPAGRQPIRITTATHPLFADAWDSGIPFPALPQQRLWDWNLAPDAQPLLTIGTPNDSSTPLPFLVCRPFGAGYSLVINASADRTWGDFPLSPAFVPLVQQIARFSSAQRGYRKTLVVGDPIPLPPTLPTDKPLTLNLPSGEQRTLPARNGARSVLLQSADLPGFYEAAAGDQQISLPVNTNRIESDLRPIAMGVLEKVMPNTEYFCLVGPEALRQWLAQSKGMAPLWPLLLILALALFFIEEFLANYLARRRFQGEEKQIAIGRLNRRKMGGMGMINASIAPSQREKVS